LEAILKLDLPKLAEVCGNEFQQVVFTAREWSQMKELCSVLEPLKDATELTQGVQNNN